MLDNSILEKEETEDAIEYKTTTQNRRKILQLLGTAAGSIALAGCAGGDGDGGDGGNGSDGGSSDGGGSTDAPDETESEAQGQTTDKNVRLRIGITNEPWNLDPALHTDIGSSIVDSLVYDELVGLSPDDELVPELAASLAEPVDDSGAVWDHTLKEGVLFHNGDEMTAEDLKYSFDWIGNPENNAAVLGYAPQLENAETEIRDDYTLRLTLNEPNSLWNAWLTRAIEGVVPKGSRGEASDAKGPKGIGTNLTTEPIGTGPFQLVEWKSGSHITLEAFEDHFRNTEQMGPPLVDEIRLEFIAESSTRLSRLRSDNLDMINRVPAKDFESLKGQPNINAKSIPGRRTLTNYFNHNPTAFGEDNPVRHVENRRAIHYAIDAEAILNDVWRNQGVVQKGPWFPDSDWTSPRLKEMSMYDPDRARSELESGPNPDGFQLTVMAENNATWRQTATIIQNQLSQIGIEAEIQTMDSSTLFSRLYETSRWHMASANWFQSIGNVFWWLFAGFAPQRNHNNWHHEPEDGEMGNSAWEPNGPAPPEDARSEFGSGPGSGHAWYRARIQEAFSTTDQEAQREIAYELQEYIVENVIQSDMAYVNRIEAWQNEVKGYEMGRFTGEFRTAAINGNDSVPAP